MRAATLTVMFFVLTLAGHSRAQTPWIIEKVDGSAPVDEGTRTSLALDPDGNPHISFVDESNEDLRYAVKYGETWFPETVFGSTEAGDGEVGR